MIVCKHCLCSSQEAIIFTLFLRIFVDLTLHINVTRQQMRFDLQSLGSLTKIKQKRQNYFEKHIKRTIQIFFEL